MLTQEEKVDRHLKYKDGLTHVNIERTGLTDLGRMLATPYISPFIHPKLGTFKSVLNFWLYLQLPVDSEKIKTLNIKQATMFTKSYELTTPCNFRDLIFEANWHKVNQNKMLKDMFTKSTLPFYQYHIVRPGPDGRAEHMPFPVEKKSSVWFLPQFEKLRQMFKYDIELVETNCINILNREKIL